MTYWMQDTGAGERRTRVRCGRVTCLRLGEVGLDRCRECVYLKRLELDDTSGFVVCAKSVATDDADFAW